MSSSRSIEQALAKTQRHLLVRFMSTLLLCLLLVELIVGAIFFFDLYQTEKKILTSMSTEYQRILTYDSSERLIHVLEANPHRLLENNIAAYKVEKGVSSEGTFIAGTQNLSTEQPLSSYQIDDHRSWLESFVLSPYMSLPIEGEQYDFWLVLDNRARDFIAYNQWLMTLYALLALVAVTAVFTRNIIQSAMSPLVTFGDLLYKLKKGQLEFPSTKNEAESDLPQGLNVISSSVHTAVAKLQHVTTTLNTTVDAIAHDIRTPLSRITLASQTALLNNADQQAMKDALADCSEHAMQASNMLTALMKLNDELTGKRIPQKVPTQVSDVIANVVSWYEDVAEDKQVELEVESADALVIQSDPDKLTQVLVNLVDNAIKYTEPEGRVTVKAEQSSEGKIAITIQDTGVGIEQKYQDLIFERLYRVDSSRSNIEGYGLGLSLALAMVENLEGTLVVESELGVGSTFTLSL
ncbi:sensor histidine kinase [Vibrio splendidus]|uniref:sensor histidine kinase n=1 Tax=Vibrio splendidus TaxID=29497 RepID=UPI001C079C53|nr:HAMP domain-containing sensor histidine kinase [Vibrio splendidus]MBU2910973.1 HAMP domain-containing histidine kinase [Vibrio splendidus]MDO6528566.1 HAMP domain-containing sensor histidine kinase [Vibrio splendidus]MDO6549621.1 HAMP domain-containing sensor histidine kinase [Vibrio splendidus]